MGLNGGIPVSSANQKVSSWAWLSLSGYWCFIFLISSVWDLSDSALALQSPTIVMSISAKPVRDNR